MRLTDRQNGHATTQLFLHLLSVIEDEKAIAALLQGELRRCEKTLAGSVRTGRSMRVCARDDDAPCKAAAVQTKKPVIIFYKTKKLEGV